MYTAAFFVFWGCSALASWLTVLLSARAEPVTARDAVNCGRCHLSARSAFLSDPSADADAAARLAGLLDSAMDAIISVDEAQNIVLYNRAAERIFGWPADQAIGQPLTMLIPERFQAAHAGHVRRFGETGVTSRRMSGATVVYGRRADGRRVSGGRVHLAGGRARRASSTPSSCGMSRRGCGREQEQSRLAQRLSGLLDSAMDGIITVDEQQHIILYNQAAEKIFGWPGEQVMGRSLDMLMPERFRAGHREHIRRFAATGVTSRRMGDSTVIHGLRSSGEEFPMDASISQLDTAEGKLFTVILRDVTERVRAQEDLAAFAAEANAIREQEKSRVARELHDELAQSLTALKMDTIWVRENLGGDPAGASSASSPTCWQCSTPAWRPRAASPPTCGRCCWTTWASCRPSNGWCRTSAAHRHRRANWMRTRSWNCTSPMRRRCFASCRSRWPTSPSMRRPRRCSVAIARSGKLMLLSVRDNGVGFSPAAARKPHSLGLAGLRERAQLLKGTISVHSQPGEGTTVEARIPVGERRRVGLIQDRDCRRPRHRARRAQAHRRRSRRTWRWWTKRLTAPR